MAHTNRVVILVDMDCFYCQVEENLDKSIQGKPIAVVQYNAWRGGGIIAVNYPARDRGVTRHMRGDEAQKMCPEIQLVRVPNVRGKADLTKYREAGKRVASVLQTFTTLLERASVDEAYLDITDAVNLRLQNYSRIKGDDLQSTHVVGFQQPSHFLESIYGSELPIESNLKLAIGGAIAEEIRAEVLLKTGYKCSAGIAHNKVLAKLVCGLHKPNQQTILPHDSVPLLYEDMPIRKIKSLGGKFGQHITEQIGIEKMHELLKFSERELSSHFDDKTANWLYNIARGIDLEPVTIRLVSKSIGCCKKFPGRSALTTSEAVEHWLTELATEISERLEKDTEENNRKAKQMVINFSQPVNKKDVSSSRTHVLNSYESSRITSDAYEVIKRFCMRADGSFCIKFLGISAGKFEDLSKSGNDITSFFKRLEGVNGSKTEGQKLEGSENDDITPILKRRCDINTQNKKEESRIKSFFKRIEQPNSAATDSKCIGLNVEVYNRNEDTKNDLNIVDESKTSFSDQKYTHNINDFESAGGFNKDVANIQLDTNEASQSHLLQKDIPKKSFFRNFFKADSNVIGNDQYESIDIKDNPAVMRIANEFQNIPLSRSEDMQVLIPEDSGTSISEHTRTSSSKNTLASESDASEDNQALMPKNTTTLMSEGQKLESMDVNQNSNSSTDSVDIDSVIVDVLEEELKICSQNMERSHEDNLVKKYSHYTQDTYKICPECDKKVDTQDFVSHMDYHVALQIVRDEADLYKPVRNNIEVKPKSPKKIMKRKNISTCSTKKSTGSGSSSSVSSKKKLAGSSSNAKRKIGSDNNSNKLTQFLITNMDDNVPTETCEECNRKIRLEEFPDHIDYHVAKKLHLELNPSFSRNKSDDKKVSAVSSTVNQNGNSITSFFKPL